MADQKSNPKVDAFIERMGRWSLEASALRAILLGSGLCEELKWGKPAYTADKKLIAIIIPLKEYCMLSFANGALLKDPAGILLAQTENVQQARVVKFISTEEIALIRDTLTQYLEEAIMIARLGVTSPKVQTMPPLPEELSAIFAKNPALKAAFEALTPGRQRAYLLHFAQPKQSATRVKRIKNNTQRILDGKGLNDR